MKTLLKLFYYLLLLTVIVNFLYFQTFAAEQFEAVFSFPSTPSTEVIQAAESNPIPKIVPGADNIVFGDTGVASDLGPEATIPNAISDVSGIAGADLTKVLGYLIEGNAITSTLGGNFIPFYNLVDGSVVGFNLDKNEKISVKQLLNGKFMNEFKTTLSKGAKLRQMFKDSDGVISFEATDDASFFVRKDNNYEFENGILTFRGNNFIENITTKDKTKAVIDKDYGVLQAILGRNASYSYENIKNPESNFLVENKNPSQYTLDIRKRQNDKVNDNFIDFVNHKIQLNGIINLKKKVKNSFEYVYEGLNKNNKIILDLNEDNSLIKKFYLETNGRNDLARIYTSYYKIIEKNEKEYKRYIDFNKESARIERYYSSMDPNLIVTVDEDEILRQSNNWDMISDNSNDYQACLMLLKLALNYEDETFWDKC